MIDSVMMIFTWISNLGTKINFYIALHLLIKHLNHESKRLTDPLHVYAGEHVFPFAHMKFIVRPIRNEDELFLSRRKHLGQPHIERLNLFACAKH